MLIRLIGPVRIATADRGAAIAAPKRACVLAALAARPGVPVSQADLIGRVWGADPPDTVTSVLYTYITHLRAGLRDTGAEIRRAGTAGYVLDVPEDQVDVHVVRALAAEAAAGGVGALEKWRRACELSDSVPLAGVGGQWAAEFREAFTQERLSILSDRFTAELAAGNHEAVLGELTAVVDAEPLCEPLAAHLMLALYRCGRPAEALTHFEAVRVRLRDELGADPSVRLRELHVRVLAQDPGLDPSPADGGPAMLPADIASFVGREEELAAIGALATEGSAPVIAVTGPGGAGKTALAVHWGHTSRDRFPGGQLYLNLRGFDRGEVVTPVDALSRLLTALGVKGDALPSDVHAAAEMYRVLTARRASLVVLDNARDAAQVRPLLPGEGCVTLVTSRDRLTGLVALNDAQPVSVPMLSPGEAREIMERLLGERRVKEELDATERLAELCGYLPLALRIAVAHLAVDAEKNIGSYVATLEGADRLAELTVEGDPQATVSANLELSYHVLSDRARALFLAIGTLPGQDVPRDLVEAVAGLEPSACSATLRQLVAGHLIEEHKPGRYRMHDLVRLYAEARAVRDLPDQERERLLDEFIEWHAEFARDYSSDEEENVFMACEALRDHPKAARLALGLRNAITLFRYLARARAVLEPIVRRTDGNKADRFRTTGLLASITRMEGDVATAVELARRNVALAAELGADERLSARSSLAPNLVLQGDYRGAVQVCAEALDLPQVVDDPRAYTSLANTTVTAYQRLGEPDRAGAFLARVEALPGVSFTERHRARFRVLEAVVLNRMELFEAATVQVDRAEEIAVRTGDKHLEAWSLNLRMTISKDSGMFRQARDTALRLLDFTRENDMPGIEFETLASVAEMEAALGDFHRAAEFLDASMERSPAGYANAQANLQRIRARIANGLGDHAAAAEAATAAVEGYRALHWPLNLADALDSLATAREALGDHAAAARHRAEATELA